MTGIHDRSQHGTAETWHKCEISLCSDTRSSPIIVGYCASLISLISSEENFPSYRENIGFTATKMNNKTEAHLMHLKMTQCMAEIMEKATLPIPKSWQRVKQPQNNMSHEGE